MNKYFLSLLYMTSLLHSAEPILFSSFFTDANKQTECQEAVEHYLFSIENEYGCPVSCLRLFLKEYLYMNPALANLRKQLMNAVLRNNDGKLSQEELNVLMQNKDFKKALQALRKDNMIATHPQRETHIEALYYYLKILSEQPNYGLQLNPRLKNEFQTIYECWEDSSPNSIMLLSLHNRTLTINYVKSEYPRNLYKEETVTVSPEFKDLFFQLIGGKGKVYINRKDLGKFFADQITAEELFIKRNLNATYQKLHSLLEQLRSHKSVSFDDLQSLVNYDSTLLSEQEKQLIQEKSLQALQTIVYSRGDSTELSSLLALVDPKDTVAQETFGKMLVTVLQNSEGIPIFIRKFLFEHVKLASLPVETPGYAPVAQTLGTLHEIAVAGIKHYLIPHPTAEKPLTVSDKPDHKSTRKECPDRCKTHYYLTNESSPIEVTLRDDGTCHVVKTVATKFAMRFHPPTAQYPETKNCLTKRSDDDAWNVIGYYEVIALPVDLEKSEWNLNTIESQILKNLMGLETGKTVVTDSTGIQLFLEGFYHGLSGSTKTKDAKDYIKGLKSTNFNCGRSFIYEKEGHCKNERYPSVF